MNELWIPQKNILVEYPSCFDELRGVDDAIKIGEILSLVFTKQIDVFSAKKLAADYFLRRKNKKKKPTKGEDAWDYWANEFRISETMNWMFHITDTDKAKGKKEKKTEAESGNQEQKESYQLNPKLTRQHIDKIRLKGATYYGPGDLFNRISFIEFKEMLVCVEQFGTTGEAEMLDRLAAILYAKRNRFWQVMKLFGSDKWSKRRKFSGERVRKAQSHLKDAPIGFKFWNFLFVIGCLNYLKDEPIEIDGRQYRLDCLFAGGGKSKDDTGLTGLLFTMAENGVFGTLEDTSHANYYDIALRLYQMHKQAQDLKSKK